MKLSGFIAVVIAFLISGSLDAASVSEVFREARADFNRGDLAVAKVKFEKILEANPNHTGSKVYLKRIIAKETTTNSLKSQIERIMLNGVNFNEASLGSVLDFLSQAAKEASNGETSVSFVSRISSEELKNKMVTLSLKNKIPFTEVLRYVGNMTDVRFTIEQYAITVESRAQEETSAEDPPLDSME